MPRRILLVIGVSTAWGYLVIKHGGVERPDRYIAEAAIGLIALVWQLTPSRQPSEPLRGVLQWTIALLTCYPLLQLTPLPAAWLALASPARAELAGFIEQLTPAHAGLSSRAAPLSVSPPATFAYFLMIGSYVLLFLMTRDLAIQWGRMAWVMAVPIVLVASVEAGVGLVQSFSGASAVSATGTYGNRNHFSGLLEMALPFAVIYPLALLQQHRRSLSAGAAISALPWMAAAALLLEGILYSFSRMGFASCLFSLLVMAALYFSQGASRRTLLAGSVVAALALVAVLALLPPAQLISRFGDVNSETLAPEGRVELYKESFRLFAHFPAFGCGLGGFESAFMRYKASGFLFADDFVHNDYIQFLTEMGVAGFAIAAALMGTLVFNAVRTFALGDRSEAYFLQLACLGSFAAIGLHSAADFNLYIPANAMLLAWICGISSGESTMLGRANGGMTMPSDV